MTTTPPELTSTSPMDGQPDVPLNATLSVAFDMAMEPFSEATFTLKQGDTRVPGTVALSADGTSATFSPSSGLAASTVFTATITSSAKSTAGASFAAARSWTFTTGVAADTSPPRVGETTPSADTTDMAVNRKVSVTFTKAMDPLSLTSASFTVRQGTTQVPGSVTYGPGTTATFTPEAALASNTLFTASLGSSIKDLNGNLLAEPFTWSFQTGATAAKGPMPVSLGTAGNFAILAKSGVSSVPASTVTGDMGVSPAAASYLTGFSLVADATNVFATSTQLVGKAYAANSAVPTPSNLTTAVSNMEGAYNNAAGRPTPNFLNLGSGNIGGKTLVPGLYKWTSTVTVPTDVTLSGGPNDVWIFQTTGDLTVSAARRVTLAGGALAKNVFWQVAGRTTVGASAHFAGVLLCKTDVTLQTGATLNGRILSQTNVALQQATVTQPAR
ncbi:ice-binding family protein [Corallococcus sp. CA053C]|uniref:ice-binding family protein n=1 Tax=Corallococcus sp. CA053C TaxID=2316732 RepID=UPI0013156B1F|nr:ice-binding family protein [Corallococcus sp. CA053C]